MLFEAMSALDPVTNLPRGYLLLSSQPLLDSAMFTLDIRQDGWEETRSFAKSMPALLEDFSRRGALDQRPDVVSAAVAHLVSGLPRGGAGSFIVVREQASKQPDDRCVPHKTRETLLTELRGMPLYQVRASPTSYDTILKSVTNMVQMVSEALETVKSSASHHRKGGGEVTDDVAFLAERATLLLLLQPPSAWPTTSSWALSAQWAALVDLSSFTIVAAEVRVCVCTRVSCVRLMCVSLTRWRS